MNKGFAQVVFGIPVDKAFCYRIPHGMRAKAELGARVWAPFHNSVKLGYIVELLEESPVDRTKDLKATIGDKPVLDEKMLALTRWVSRRYFCSWGQAIEAALPQGIRHGRSEVSSRALLAQEDYELSFDLEPLDKQRRAIKKISSAISSSEFCVFLLHGITGSGKTEVYLQAIRRAREEGKSAIVLVPEIALTPQTAQRLKSRFQEEVSILHSGLTPSQRFHEWEKAKDGQAKIVIGARSAIFAPLKDVGLVVVDEEHENTYKQQDAPRYHARDAAIERARAEGGVVILSSATPSVESYYNANKGEYKLLELTQRAKGGVLPRVTIIDMRNYQGRNNRVLSQPLVRALERTLAHREQAILFLNRRGFSSYVFCPACGYVVTCTHCGIALVYHAQHKSFVCHWCNRRREPAKLCPECKRGYLNYRGIGTQRVESELARLFPQARIARMDTDATAKRGSHKDILSNFRDGKIDILVGTQMVAKGHDFSNLSLVGVVSADVTLNLPDFRASERTFNLLTQVAGRAGRELKEGNVYIQTYTPSHYTIALAKSHAYADFYKREIIHREELQLPPFSRLISLTLQGKIEDEVKEAAQGLADRIKERLESSNAELLGPAPDVRPKLRGRYRWNITVKSKDIEKALDILRGITANYKKPSGAQLVVDVDPL